MHIHKTPNENKVTGNIQKQQIDSKVPLLFSDNRPEAIVQRRLQEFIRQSSSDINRGKGVTQRVLNIDPALFSGERKGGIKMKNLLEMVTAYNDLSIKMPKPKPVTLIRELDMITEKVYKYNKQMTREENELHSDTLKQLASMIIMEKSAIENNIKPLTKEEAFVEAGEAVVGLFMNPKSIWGAKHGDIAGIPNFVEVPYQGTSDAHEYIMTLSDNSKISIVVNYGGGRHSHALEQKKYDPAFYYKLEWPAFFPKMKVVEGKSYPAEDMAQETYKFIVI